MKQTILLAILTSCLAQFGIYEVAELSYVAASGVAGLRGGSAIRAIVGRIQREASSRPTAC